MNYWVTIYLLGVLVVLIWQLAEYFGGFAEISLGTIFFALTWPVWGILVLIALLYVLVDADLKTKPWRRPK